MKDGNPAKGADQSLPRSARLTDSDGIRTLVRRGKRRKTRHLDVFVSASPVGRSRIGHIVPKPRGKTAVGPRGARGAAVQRNRLKRRLREIARTVLLPSLRQQGCSVDVIIRARPEAYAATFDELKHQLASLQEWMCSSGV